MKNLKLEIGKIHGEISKEKNWKHFSTDFEVHKKLLLAFQPGPAYFWILDTQKGIFDMMSPEIEAVLGFEPEEATFSFLLERIHPDDTPYLLNFENAIAEFIAEMSSEKRHRYKYQYDFRIQRSDGKYVRILNQLVIITYNADINLIRTFGVHADITHLKTDPKPRLSFIGFEGEPSYYSVIPKTIFQPTPGIFSTREREILELIVEGKTSKQIGESLFISKFTVDTHRKQMLRKAKCRSASELISKAILEAWIQPMQIKFQKYLKV